MQDIRIPSWIKSEEDRKCYDEIMAIGREIHSFGLIAENSNTKYFLLEIDAEEVSDDIKKRLYDFNDGTRPLIVDVVLAHQNVRGDRYVII